MDIDELKNKYLETRKDNLSNSDLIEDALLFGYKCGQSVLWHKISDCLPSVGETVIVLTSNNKIAVSLMYIPKDSKGNIISEKPEWKGSRSFTDSIIAWMEVPVLS